MQPSDVGTEVGLGAGNGGGQRLGPRALRHVGNPVGEVGPLLVGQFVAAERVDGLLGQCAELVVGEVLERGADHPDLRRKLRLHEVGHSGKQLAFGQVAGRAEQHDDVRRERLAVLAPGRAPGDG